jgi:hypothetical protein
MPAPHRLTPLELRQLKWMLGNLLALVSLWTLVYIEVQAGILLAATALGVLTGMIRPALPGRLPAVVWRVVVPIALTAAVLTDFFLSQPDIVPPLVRMLLLLTLVRCLQKRRRREDLQLVLMCLFMVMLVGVLTLSITFGLQMLLFAPVAMGVLFLVTLTEPASQPYTPADMEYRWEQFRWRPFVRRIWAAQDLRIFAIIGTLFAGVMAVSSLIFILIPRFQINQAIPFLTLNTTASLSGFSERIAFGDVVDIIEDDRIALRVDVPDRTRAAFTPYWRMVVLDEYHRGGFQMSGVARAQQTPIRTNFFRLPGRTAFDPADQQTWTFYLEGGISRYLPLAGLVSSIRFQERQRLEYQNALQMINTQRISGKVLFYQTQSDAAAEEIPATALEQRLPAGKSIEMPEQGVPEALSIPYPYTTMMVPAGAQNLAVLDGILRRIMAGRPLSPRAFSAAAVAYLRERHGYALRVTIPEGGRDLMVRWLDADLPGHCELFAGAFTLLARRAGYPTRVVTGFKGGSWNGYEQYYMVRNRHAHAWCEVYDGASAWFRVDPTPGGEEALLEAGTARRSLLDIDRTLGAYFDSLKILWYRRIVKFDRTQQREMAGYLREASRAFAAGMRERVRDGIHAVQGWMAGLWSGGFWQAAARLALIAGVLFAAIRFGPDLIRRLLARRAVRSGRMDPVRRQAGRWLRMMPPAAVRLRTDDGQGVYQDLLRLRYGRPAAWPDHRRVFRAARRLVRRTG